MTCGRRSAWRKYRRPRAHSPWLDQAAAAAPARRGPAASTRPPVCSEETGFSHEVSVGPAHHGTIWEGGTCRDCGSTVTRPRSPSRDPVWILRTPRDPEAYLEHEAEERGVRLSWTEKDGAVVVGIKGDPSRTRIGNVRSEAPDATASASVSAVGHAQRGTPAAHSAPTTGGLVRERA
jgi:hypothetical protein